MKNINIIRRIFLLLLLCAITTVSAQQQNYLTASGNKLFDSTGKEVRMTGVNWFGFETQNFFPHGIWTRDMKSVLQQIKDLGFNTIRVPWCNQMLDPGVSITIPSYGSDAYTGISPMNEEETNITKPIELLDVFVRWCQENDMKIVLDNHSRAADGFLSEAVWYTPEYSEERWINDWIFMAERYKGISAVVAMDLNNEPHGSTWGNSNPATDWNKAAERCGNAILKVNPDVLIVVEGVGEFEGNSYWWGGQLMGAKPYPVQLSDPSKLMYSAHEYGPEVAPQDWFNEPNFPQNMPQIWSDNYHYLYEEETSPILLGEFGIKDQNAFGGIAFTWFEAFTDFMGGIYSWTFWSMNPNSGDTGGILKDDWSSVNQWKLDVLQPHMAPLIPNVVGGTGPINRRPIARFTSNVTSGDAPLTVQFDGSGSSDPDGDSLTYSWNFGDGTSATGADASHVFDPAGEYTVTLTVSDGSLSNSTSTIITANNIPDDPQVIVTANISTSSAGGEAPIVISFDGSGSSSSDGSALTYSWNFGDGNSATGSTASNQYTTEGSYVVTLTVTNASGNTDTDTTTVVITEKPDTGGGGGDCSFGAPLASSLPTISNVAYTQIYVLGNGGPDLSNVTNFTINWDLANNGLWQFSMNTNNGTPSWWNNLLTNITSQSFNAAQPSITLQGTGFSNLDGSYYATMDGENFVLVSIDGGFTIYFSNSTTPPACSQGVNGLNTQVLGNPIQDRLVLKANASLDGAFVDMVNIVGNPVKTVRVQSRSKQITLDTSDIPVGIYFIRINKNGKSQTLKVVKN